MNTVSLDGDWQLRFSTGQRGGSPYVLKHSDDREHDAEFCGTPRHLPGHYRGGAWLNARVPGEVHLDLMRAGLLEDPRDGINIYKARWVEESVWYYRRTFEVPAEALCEHSVLVFDELDLSAIVYLNGEEIGRHENVFCPLILPMDGRLRPGENELVVRLDSGLFNVCEKPIRDRYSATADAGLLLTKRMWMRKPQYEAEWDWSPRLLNVGISGHVRLLFDPQLCPVQWQLRQEVSADLSSAQLTARLFSAENADKDADCRLEMEVDGQVVTASGHPEQLTVTAHIPSPRLWYPVGYGEQALYPVTLRLFCKERLVWQKETVTGFRRVEADQSPHPEKGHYFFFRINGRPVFFKGANLVPLSLFPAAVTAEEYDRLTDRALEANMNMLRIWGGGLYEREELFALCDRKGLLLWQEFISACAYPPEEDPALFASMLEEAAYQVRRLSVHPSLVVWCGNNELPPWGHRLYMEEYPRILRENDPEKYYQPASPYTDNALPFAPDNEAGWDYAGDQHPWQVGFSEKDHRLYRQMECRFPNEGGILGPVCRPSLARITDGKGDFWHSVAFEAHDNMLAFMREGTSPDEDLRFWLGFPPERLTLDAYIAAGGYVQGEGLSDYIGNFRRRAFSSSSAIFWMLNDCWPCSRSWTILDDEGRRNPAFYAVSRAFAPIRPVLVEGENGCAEVYGINDTDSTFGGVLSFGVFRSDSEDVSRQEQPIRLPARTVTRLAALPSAAAPQTESGSLPIAFALLSDESGRLIARDRLLTHRYFAYRLLPPVIQTVREGDYTVFQSDRYVMGVCLDLDGEAAMSDNLFDLYPGIPYRVRTAGQDTVLYTLNTLLENTPPC